MGSLSSPTTIAQVTGLQKKLAAENLRNESSYALHRNHRVRRSHYRKTEAFFSGCKYYEQTFFTLSEIQRHNVDL